MTKRRQSGRTESRHTDVGSLRSRVAICVALACVTTVVFAGVRNFDFVDYDDLDYVVDNVNVSSGVTWTNIVWALRNAYTHTGGPLTWWSYQLEAGLFGVVPSSFHVVNLGIHILASCVLFLVLQAATRARWSSAWVAAIFAIHPLHVESVAWVSERKDVLAGLFSFLTVGAYLAFARRGGAWRYGLLVLAYACALMSKPTAVVIPALLLCLDYWPLGRYGRSGDAPSRTIRTLLLEKVPLFAMAAIVAVLTVLSQASLGTMSSFDSVPVGARIANAVAALGWYVQKSAWPTNLAAIYPLRIPVPFASVLIGGAVVITLAAFVWTQRRSRPWVTAGLAWFLIALIPVSGLFQTGAHAYADRNMYLPLTGLAVAAAWTLTRWASAGPARPPLAAALAVVTLVAAGWQANLQSRHWTNSESLFRRALAVTDGNYIAATGLATTLRRRGELEEPMRLYREALNAAPGHAAARAGLGETLLAQGAANAAVYELSRAVEIDPGVPEFWVNLGSALRGSGRVAESVHAFRRALVLAPDRADVHSGLGAALAEMDDPANALKELETALRLDPHYADALVNLGLVNMRAGNAPAALACLERARQLSPHSLPALTASGSLLMQLGRFDQAAEVLGKAAALAPSDARLRSNLGGALLAAGKLAEAEAQLREAARIAPDLEPVRANLELLERHRRKSR